MFRYSDEGEYEYVDDSKGTAIHVEGGKIVSIHISEPVSMNDMQKFLATVRKQAIIHSKLNDMA